MWTRRNALYAHHSRPTAPTVRRGTDSDTSIYPEASSQAARKGVKPHGTTDDEKAEARYPRTFKGSVCGQHWPRPERGHRRRGAEEGWDRFSEAGWQVCEDWDRNAFFWWKLTDTYTYAWTPINSKRAREERALAAERRLLGLQGQSTSFVLGYSVVDITDAHECLALQALIRQQPRNPPETRTKTRRTRITSGWQRRTRTAVAQCLGP